MNIVLIMADSLRSDALGCCGNAQVKTPNIDLLAGAGLRFDTCYSTSPLCVPARAQLLSGKHCHETGNMENPAWMAHTPHPVEVDGVYFEPEITTLPSILSMHDFYTGHLGKNHFYPRHNMMGFHHMEQCDFYGRHVYEIDDYYLHLKAGGYGHLFRDAFGRVDAPGGAAGVMREEFGLLDRLCPYISKVPAELQTTPWLGNRAAKFIRNAPKGLPFFLTVSFYAPHDPYCVSPPHDQMIDPDKISLPLLPEKLEPSTLYAGEQSLRQEVPPEIWRQNIAHYLANVSLIDAEVGRIIDTLKQQERYDDTLIIITSDHGDTLGEHHIWGKNLLYEDCARVPLIFHHGGGGIANGVTSQIATLLDLFPTFLDQVGVNSKDDRLAGKPLDLSSVHDGTDSRAIYGELSNPPSPQYFVRSQEWKLIRLEGHDAGELYNLHKDPSELNNLASELPNELAELSSMLDGWMESEKPFWKNRLSNIQVNWEQELRMSHL
ncbi:MAG: hypothetical protein CMN78_02240 [Spirochaetales bacterium]|nr:hypothetical protein [Spirochaetales bacterium]